MPRAWPNRRSASRSAEAARSAPTSQAPDTSEAVLDWIRRSYSSSLNCERVVRQELPHLADRHLVGHPAHHPERLEVVETDQLDHGPGVQVVAHDHRDLVAEQGVDRRHAPAEDRVVHRVVVHQGGQMDQLDDRREGRGPRIVGRRSPRRRGAGAWAGRACPASETDARSPRRSGRSRPPRCGGAPAAPAPAAARSGRWMSARETGAVRELIPAVPRRVGACVRSGP